MSKSVYEYLYTRISYFVFISKNDVARASLVLHVQIVKSECRVLSQAEVAMFELRRRTLAMRIQIEQVATNPQVVDFIYNFNRELINSLLSAGLVVRLRTLRDRPVLQGPASRQDI